MSEMRSIYIICGGTRGDKYLFIMPAVRLKALGFRIVFYVGPEGAQWTAGFGFEHLAPPALCFGE